MPTFHEQKEQAAAEESELKKSINFFASTTSNDDLWDEIFMTLVPLI